MTLNGALVIGKRSSDAVTGSLDAARSHGLEAPLLGADELGRRFPSHVIAGDDVGVLDFQAGFIRPEAAITAMIERLTALGGDLRRNARVTAVTARTGGVEVATLEATELFDAAVLAAGPWTSELAPWLPVTVERQVMAWFRIVDGSAESLSPERFPVFYRDAGGLGHIYGLPTLDGVSMKIGRHHLGQVAEPNGLVRDVTDADLDPLRMFITTNLRGVTRHVTRTAVCMYTNTTDGRFVVDLHPDGSRLVLISACSGHGFKFAPVIGDIAADLVLDGGTARDISRFTATRFAKR